MQRTNERQEVTTRLSERSNDLSQPLNKTPSQDRGLPSAAEQLKPEQPDARKMATGPKTLREPEVSIDQPEGSAAPENRRRTGEGAVRGGEKHRFKPGQSGNPGGRPKTGALTRAFRAVLEQPVPGDRQKRTYAQAIAERLVDLAMRGHLQAVRELGDRAEGRTVSSVQLTDLLVEDERPGPVRVDFNAEVCTEELQGQPTAKKIKND
jgi:hypothetical protein